MKRMLTIAAAAALLLAGCQNGRLTTTTAYAGTGDVVTTITDSAAELGKAYYGQPNMAKVIEIEGTNLVFAVSGATRFCLSCPVPAKQIIPREQSWYSGLADSAKTIAPWLFMGYWIHEGGFGNSRTTTTTNN